MKKTLMSAASAVALVAIEASPALAQVAGGGLDVQTGTTAIVNVILIICGLLALAIAAWLGIEAMQNHRSIMPSMISLIFGLGMIFGGAYYLQKFGVGGGVGLGL